VAHSTTGLHLQHLQYICRLRCAWFTSDRRRRGVGCVNVGREKTAFFCTHGLLRKFSEAVTFLFYASPPSFSNFPNLKPVLKQLHTSLPGLPMPPPRARAPAICDATPPPPPCKSNHSPPTDARPSPSHSPHTRAACMAHVDWPNVRLHCGQIERLNERVGLVSLVLSCQLPTPCRLTGASLSKGRHLRSLPESSQICLLKSR
jgi:hypothetical protein